MGSYRQEKKNQDGIQPAFNTLHTFQNNSLPISFYLVAGLHFMAMVGLEREKIRFLFLKKYNIE
jgi:hypothetical protein